MAATTGAVVHCTTGLTGIMRGYILGMCASVSISSGLLPLGALVVTGIMLLTRAERGRG